jgi:hypothetical protein
MWENDDHIIFSKGGIIKRNILKKSECEEVYYEDLCCIEEVFLCSVLEVVKKRGRYLEVLLCVKDNIRLSTQ